MNGDGVKHFLLSWEGFWTAVTGAVVATIAFIKVIPEVLRILLTFKEGALYTLAIKETLTGMESRIIDLIGKLDDGQLNLLEVRRHMLDADPNSVYFQTDPAGKTEWVSKTWTVWTGLSTDDARGSGWENGVAPDELPRVQVNWGQAIDHQRNYQDVFHYINRLGERTRVEVKATAIRRKDGTILNYFGNARISGMSSPPKSAHFLPADPRA